MQSFPAENLLKGDGFSKWKCANVGEKQATVTLQVNVNNLFEYICTWPHAIVHDMYFKS